MKKKSNFNGNTKFQFSGICTAGPFISFLINHGLAGCPRKPGLQGLLLKK